MEIPVRTSACRHSSDGYIVQYVLAVLQTDTDTSGRVRSRVMDPLVSVSQSGVCATGELKCAIKGARKSDIVPIVPEFHLCVRARACVCNGLFLFLPWSLPVVVSYLQLLHLSHRMACFYGGWVLDEAVGRGLRFVREVGMAVPISHPTLYQ